MRQAIVSVRDGDGSALGLQGVVTPFREAGLAGVDVLTCEGMRSVVRADVEGSVDVEEVQERPEVVWIEEVAASGPGSAYLVEIDVGRSDDVIAACTDDLLRCSTTEVGEDRVTFDIAGTQEAISQTVEAYEAAGADVSLHALGDFEGREQPLDALTARQREVLNVAYDTGFFDVPRSASTADVAAELDIDDSTVAEHLQRAERNLLSSVLPKPA